jgi:mRNA interferase RelE/StbE
LAWHIEIKRTTQKEIEKLDKKAQTAIVSFLRERVAGAEDPRQTGKALKGEMGDLWRYRVGDYRIICDIQDGVVTVLVLRVRHRKEVYR